jgi:uncharacterized protein (DUF1810 family)
MSNEFNLSRFIIAQENSYTTALSELRAGKKRSHWIWYVFPQIKGLGNSSNSEFYGLAGLAEARAYLNHPLLGHRLKEATAALLAHRLQNATAILGEIDALKFKSCLTLFSLADPSERMFTDALEQFFAGKPDARTIELLKARGEV